MKLLSLITLLLLLNPTENQEQKQDCDPDRGIKTAITTATLKSRYATLDDLNIPESSEVHYNTMGRPTLIAEGKLGTEHRREYVDGKLQHIITTRKDLPDFYLEEELDSLITHSKIISDTAFIVSHHGDGRPYEMLEPNGFVWQFEYSGCEIELITVLYPEGDTLQQIEIINENGLPIERRWTPFLPKKMTSTTTYFGYTYNEEGHWISRKYIVRDGTVHETRSLTYY
jgi:hypothetical protein